MGKIVLVVILVTIGIVIKIVAGKMSKQFIDRDAARLKTGSTAAMFLCFVISIGLLVWSTFRIVEPGTTGVVVIMGNTADVPLPAGLNITAPWAEVHPMDIKIQKHDTMYDAASKDLQEVKVMMVLNYALTPASAPKVFEEIGSEQYAPTIIDPAAQEVLKAEIALHNASEILKTRPQIKQVVQDNMKVWLDKYGITLHEVSLSNIDFSDEYDNAIEKKQLEEQKAQQKEYELQQAQKQAEIAKAEAEGKANAKIEEARAEAEALKLKGEAQADYNRKVAESLTPTLVQREYIEKWDGILPRMMTGGQGTSLLFQIPVDEK